MNEVMRELPRYQSHKKVRALKIADVVWDRADAPPRIVPEDDGYAPFDAPEGWKARYRPTPGDLGYYVLYEDGYASWSPTQAFEEGYTAIPPSGSKREAVRLLHRKQEEFFALLDSLDTPATHSLILKARGKMEEAQGWALKAVTEQK